MDEYEVWYEDDTLYIRSIENDVRFDSILSQEEIQQILEKWKWVFSAIEKLE